MSVRPCASVLEERRRREQNNRYACDSRQAGWHNVFLVLFDLLGYRLHIQKPPKLSPKKTLPYVPCVLVEWGSQRLYDFRRDRDDFARKHPNEPKPGRPWKTFHINQRTTLAKVFVEELEMHMHDPAQPHRVRVRTETRRNDKHPRITSVMFDEWTFTRENVGLYGWEVYAFFCEVFAKKNKGTDCPMVPFPLDRWKAPGEGARQQPGEEVVVGSPEAQSFEQPLMVEMPEEVTVDGFFQDLLGGVGGWDVEADGFVSSSVL